MTPGYVPGYTARISKKCSNPGARVTRRIHVLYVRGADRRSKIPSETTHSAELSSPRRLISSARHARGTGGQRAKSSGQVAQRYLRPSGDQRCSSHKRTSRRICESAPARHPPSTVAHIRLHARFATGLVDEIEDVAVEHAHLIDQQHVEGLEPLPSTRWAGGECAFRGSRYRNLRVTDAQCVPRHACWQCAARGASHGSGGARCLTPSECSVCSVPRSVRREHVGLWKLRGSIFYPRPATEPSKFTRAACTAFDPGAAATCSQ